MQKEQIEERTAICPVCGLPVVLNVVGRPRVYHPECKKLEGVLVWIEDLLSGKEMSPEKKRAMRGRLWYLANCLNGKGSA